MKTLFTILIAALLISCAQKPWLSEPRRPWGHQSPAYNNYQHDYFECKRYELTKWTHKIPLSLIQFGDKEFTTFDDCMYKRGYIK